MTADRIPEEHDSLRYLASRVLRQTARQNAPLVAPHRARAIAAETVDAAVIDASPGSYDTARSNFGHDLDRLTQIIAGWNPDNETMRPRIALWRDNIKKFSNRVADIDEIADDKPEIAEEALASLSTKIKFAFDRLDPQRTSAIGTLLNESNTHSSQFEEQSDDDYMPGG